MRTLKKLTLEQLEKKAGERHISGGLHFANGSMVSMQNVSVSQVISYIKSCGREFLYFATF